MYRETTNLLDYLIVLATPGSRSQLYKVNMTNKPSSIARDMLDVCARQRETQALADAARVTLLEQEKSELMRLAESLAEESAAKLRKLTGELQSLRRGVKGTKIIGSVHKSVPQPKQTPLQTLMKKSKPTKPMKSTPKPTKSRSKQSTPVRAKKAKPTGAKKAKPTSAKKAKQTSAKKKHTQPKPGQKKYPKLK